MQIYAVTVQISEVKMPQISRKNPGEHPAEGHIEIYSLRLLGMRARGCRWGLWSFQTNTMQNLDKYIEQLRQDRDTGNECKGILLVTLVLTDLSLQHYQLLY